MVRALYRKHRPKKLSEIIGQEHITDTLSRALQQGMLSHAYLLTGPRGVGKTSIARILAHEVNNLPYEEETTHFDIIEIDAASNRRIDEIRELKERVNIAPTSAKYKVYIIDEVHMLTKEAFNALLKTLEEPPEHVIFILATTEAHKVPETIQSRTQRFAFKPVTLEKVADHLKKIAKSENIVITDDALRLIAQHGEGSFRDSISLLDQIRNSNQKISLQDVQRAVGQAPDELLANLLTAVTDQNVQAVASSLSILRDHGVQAPQIAHQISHLLRQSIIGNSLVMSATNTLELLESIAQIPAVDDPGLALELALYKIALKSEGLQPALHSDETQLIASSRKTTVAPTPATIKPGNLAVKTSSAKKFTPADGGLNADSWNEILIAIKDKYNTLYGIARMASPTFESEKLILSFAFPFHQKKLNDAKNKQLLSDTILQITGMVVSVECVLDESVDPPMLSTVSEQPHRDNLDLETISNIFGGAEIVE